MDEQGKRKGGGAKTSRSETVTVRLNPQLRYLAEVEARKQRRTLSSFIEWAIERATQDVNPILWDVDKTDRFVNMALTEPDLLTYEEQKLWKMVKEVWSLYKTPREFSGSLEDRIALREHWWIFKIATKKNFSSSEAAKVLADDDEDLRNKFVLYLAEGVGSNDDD